MADKYNIIKYIRCGTTGNVLEAVNLNTKESVALKKIVLKSSNNTQKKNAFREICILSHATSRYCIYLMDLIVKEENGQLTELWLILPLMDSDLQQVSGEYNLRYFQIIKIIYQLILGLKYLSNAGIIHRDLKPANVGINRNLDVRILDFGLARDFKDHLSKEVITIWYRPLEVFYTDNYTAAVDMWSLGCIFVELLTKKVLFPGKNDFDQVRTILTIMGYPNDKLLSQIDDDTKSAFSTYKTVASNTNNLKDVIKLDVEKMLRRDEDKNSQFVNDVLDLAYQMLQLDPSERITPSEAAKFNIFSTDRCYIQEYIEDNDVPYYTCAENMEQTDEFWEEQIIQKAHNFEQKRL